MFLERLTRLFGDMFHPKPKYITVTPVTSTPVQALPPSKLPRHVAIIMDGNGRWAQSRGMSRSAGHAVGTEALREIIRASDDWGIEALSLYAFSTENWARSKEEVAALMALLLKYFNSEIDELDEKNVRITILGDIEALPAPQREALINAMTRTAGNTGLRLNIALNYGGRAELTRAARLLAEQVREGRLLPEQIDEDTFAAQLYTAGSPDVDLLIRTSGEMRTSNFLPWQMVYAEMVFDSCYWPDFDRAHYMKCLQTYAERDRRLGGVKEDAPANPQSDSVGAPAAEAAAAPGPEAENAASAKESNAPETTPAPSPEAAGQGDPADDASESPEHTPESETEETET